MYSDSVEFHEACILLNNNIQILSKLTGINSCKLVDKDLSPEIKLRILKHIEMQLIIFASDAKQLQENIISDINHEKENFNQLAKNTQPIIEGEKMERC